jgi:hypothetical protein
MTQIVGYVTAHAYSGTTLLSFVLGAHPDIATVGEMRGVAAGISVDSFSCSCGQLIRDCAFWARLADEMRGEGLPFDVDQFDLRFRSPGLPFSDRLLRAGPRGPLLETARSLAVTLHAPSRRELKRLLHRNATFIKIVSRLTGRPVFIDTSKRPGRALHLSRIPNFEMRVLHVVRDPRAVAVSCMRNLGMKLGQATGSWKKLQLEAERLKRHFPARQWMTLRHEDLCSDPKGALSRVHNFLGVRPFPPPTEFRASEHHVIGNRMRLSGESQIRLDERWRQTLTAEQARDCLRELGAVARRYDYVD